MATDLGISRTEAVRRLRTQHAKSALADRLTARVGSQAAGAYIDEETGRLVVNVTSQNAAEQVRSTTAQPQMVDRSMARLNDIKSALADRLVNGATLGIDVPSNTVLATVPADRHDATTSAFVRVVRSYGDAARVIRTPGTPTTAALYGGEGIHDDHTCSGAFVLKSRNHGEYLLTAGHCDPPFDGDIDTWKSDGHSIGPTTASTFGSRGDFALINLPPRVNAIGQVVTWGNGAYNVWRKDLPPVGTYVCKSGWKTHLTCGTITDRKRHVDYDPGPDVGGLIVTTACAKPGDSGGALFDYDHEAVGIHSGDNGGCSRSRYRSYFEDVVEAVNVYRRAAWPHLHVE